MIDNEEKFERMLEDLLDEITGFPSALLKNGPALKSNSVLHSQGIPKTLSSMQESIENMRICVKYLLFDLDATRRESLYFKKLLEEKGS